MLSGVYLSVKDPTLSVAVECFLQSFMKALCCDHYKDEAVLQELMSHYYTRDNRPQIIVSSSSERIYDMHEQSAAAAAFLICLIFFPAVL